MAAKMASKKTKPVQVNNKKTAKKPANRMNAFYAMGGGVTPVINSTALGVIETARKHGIKVYAGRHGIQGLLLEELYDTSKETSKTLQALHLRPGAAFGSCRYKLTDVEKDLKDYERIIEVCRAHNIGYVFYNGGNDSADTTHKLAAFSRKVGYPLICIGIPKTMDNDLPVTDNCPGYGSVAKFLATAALETGIDAKSMSPATEIYIMETMGRHAGWLPAASALARQKPGDPPHIILCPEIVFDEEKFLAKVSESVRKYGYCHIVTSESLKDKDGHFIADTGQRDAFGHIQKGCIAPILANKIRDRFNYSFHVSVVDYIQHSSRHLGCTVDLKQAYAVGKAAVEMAVAGKNDVSPIIVRKPGKKYQWTLGETRLENIANTEKNMPRKYITKDGMDVTKDCIDYIRPLIQGEDIPPFKNGLPCYPELKLILAPKKTKTVYRLKDERG